MASLSWWKRHWSMSGLRGEEREPRLSLRRKIDRLFGEHLSRRSLSHEMDKLFDEFGSPPTFRSRMAGLVEDFVGSPRSFASRWRDPFVPQVELRERDNVHILRVDLPGLRKEDLDIRVDDDSVLTISGERREQATQNERGYSYSERRYGSFSRSIESARGRRRKDRGGLP